MVSSWYCKQSRTIMLYQNAVKYCYSTELKQLVTSLVAYGRGCVWRLSHFDVKSSDEEVMKAIEEDEPYQPEYSEYMVVVEIGERFVID